MAALQLVALLTLAACIAARPTQRLQRQDEELELLKRFIIIFGDKKSEAQTRDVKLDTRDAFRVSAKVGEIRDFPLTTNEDTECIQTSDCSFDVTIYDNKLKKTIFDLRFDYSGHDGVTFKDLPSDGRIYSVRTCRVENMGADTGNVIGGSEVINNRCTCHECTLYDNQAAIDANDPNPFFPTGMCRTKLGYNSPMDKCQV